MRVGDLVRRKKHGYLALILEVKNSSGYRYPKIMCFDTGEIYSCSFSLLEVVSEGSLSHDV